MVGFSTARHSAAYGSIPVEEMQLKPWKGNKMANEEKKGSVLLGLFWMILISILLCWLAFVGPLLAGLVGGKKAGGVGKALLAALLPAIVFGVALAALATTMSGLPVFGAVAGAGGFVLAVSQVGPLLLGAIIGGLLA